MDKTRRYLIDACVMVDALLAFRAGHSSALALFEEFEARKSPVYIPAHAWAEYAVACITHFKRDLESLASHPIRVGGLPHVTLEVIRIDQELIEEILVSPLPDLKSADMLYYLIARHGCLTLVTADARLRNASARGGVSALSVDDALCEIRNQKIDGDVISTSEGF